MAGKYLDLDTRVKAKFKLFSGARPHEEDQQIYDRVYDLCFEETMLFLGENLSDKDRESLSGGLERAGSEDDKIKVLQNYLEKIENHSFKLDHRLDAFLDNLLHDSLTTLNG